MSKIINIGNKDYTFEFTIEASLYDECVEKITILMMGAVNDFQSLNDLKEFIVSGCVNVPKTALASFYAGLLENHSDEITSIDDAKNLMRQYMNEHKEDEKGNFFEILQLMLEVMEIDGFFEQIGLSQVMKDITDNVKSTKNNPKKPQDHKKKTTTKKATETIEK